MIVVALGFGWGIGGAPIARFTREGFPRYSPPSPGARGDLSPHEQEGEVRVGR